jgi:hypothetical protein
MNLFVGDEVSPNPCDPSVANNHSGMFEEQTSDLE